MLWSRKGRSVSQPHSKYPEKESLVGNGNVIVVKSKENLFSIPQALNSEQTTKTSDLTGNKES